MTRRAAAGLGALAGLLYWLGLPGGVAWPFAVASFAPLALAAHRGARAGAIAGAAMGVVAGGLSMSFVPTVLARYGGISAAPGVVVLVVATIVTASPFALLGAGAGWARGRGVPAAIGMALLLPTLEASLPIPFRWSLAASMVDARAIVGLADWIGAPLVGGLTVFLGASLGLACAHRAWRAFIAPGVVSAALLALAWARQPDDSGPPLDVAVIQPGAAPEVGERADDATYARHVALSREASEAGAALIVGAEGVAPGVMRIEEAAAALGDLPATSVVGAVVDDGGTLRNTALAVHGGAIFGRHDKHWLLPLSEQAPESVARWLGHRSFTEGRSPRALDLGIVKIGVTICYEELVDGALTGPVRQGAQLLVSLSHDAWFDGFKVGEVQLAHARLRAIEQRRWMLRASTTGISAIIDDQGRVVARARVGESRAVRGSVRLAEHVPPATRFHPSLRVVPGLGLMVLLSLGEYRRRRSVQRSGPVGPEIDSLTAPWH